MTRILWTSLKKKPLFENPMLQNLEGVGTPPSVEFMVDLGPNRKGAC